MLTTWFTHLPLALQLFFSSQIQSHATLFIVAMRSQGNCSAATIQLYWCTTNFYHLFVKRNKVISHVVNVISHVFIKPNISLQPTSFRDLYIYAYQVIMQSWPVCIIFLDSIILFLSLEENSCENVIIDYWRRLVTFTTLKQFHHLF